MTMAEVKSIENTLIKISVRTLWVIAGALLISGYMAASFYNNIMRGQEQILSEMRRNGDGVQYQIKDIKKDVSGLQEDMKVVKNTIK